MSQIKECAINSGQQTGDKLILSEAGLFYGIMVITDGSDAVTVEAYDSITGAGKLIFPAWVVTTSATDRAQVFFPSVPILVTAGIYIDITTSGTVKYNVFYRRKDV